LGDRTPQDVFMHTILIAGAALIGLPILLHLIMRQEPKRLPFPAFRFLKLRRRINQRKLRLRHLLLLLLRMLLIFLIALALFQPTIISDQFNIRGDTPISCIIVIDNSPSMGYVLSDRAGLTEARQRGLKMMEEPASGSWTALDDARFRAMELLEELPHGSRVAVIGTDDRDPMWALSLNEAKKKIREMKKPRASSRSVTQTLELAYNLFAREDKEQQPGHEGMPRLLCVFSDRTVPSWDPLQLDYLKSLRKRVPPPDIHCAYVDVGVDKPVNLAITGIDMSPQIVAANKPIEFTVLLVATGRMQENTIQVRFDDESQMMTQAVRVEPGTPVEKTFRRDGLTPGLHQAEITLQTSDSLPFDNIRYLTFRVREPRNVLLVADAPIATGALGGGLAMIEKVQSTTRVLRISLDATAWYACSIRSTHDFLAMQPKDLAPFEAVLLNQLVTPSPEVWDQADKYVKAGGQLIVVPGGDEIASNGRNKPPPGYDVGLLPGPLRQWIELPKGEVGITWTWNALKAHPLLNEFRDWLKNPRIDFVKNRPQVWGYWEVEVKDKPSVIVYYADDPVAEKRRPALLEKSHGTRGRVFLFTTPMDGQFNVYRDKFENRPGSWNDYPATSFHLMLSNFVVRYLTGDSEDAVFNFTNGQAVIIKWPLDAATRSKTYYLQGPELTENEAVITRDNNQPFLRIAGEKLRAAGNFKFISDPTDKQHPRWAEGFSMNPSGEESNLERVPIDQIEALLGDKSVAAADKSLKLRDILSGKFSSPVELFPFLMIVLLLFLAFENLLANRFYKEPKPNA
jgi:Aerotolerance regulator N-terminal